MNETANTLAVAALTLLVILVIAYLNGQKPSAESFASPEEYEKSKMAKAKAPPAKDDIPKSAQVPCQAAAQSAAALAYNAQLHKLTSAADYDPLITGQLYDNRPRYIYSARTSLDDHQGLTEYSSSGSAGDVGVDIGPVNLEGYDLNNYDIPKNKLGGGEGFDDGIPENFTFPSTPIHWYEPKQRDYLGPDGPVAYSDGLYELTEADHEPLMN
jgi:hypothetical protein